VGDGDPFDECIERLDCGLFDGIGSQSTVKDKRSWLALQRAVRAAKPSYVYLEIGSYLGGSLQQYLQDPRCTRIYSIDNRTVDGRHSANSAAAMLANLSAVAPDALDKLTWFDCDAGDLPPDAVREPVDLCFIDGRHTDEAVRSDFSFCLGVCAPDAVIYFHDAGVTRSGIRACLRTLKRLDRPYVAHKLPGDTFVVGLLQSPLTADSRVRELAVARDGERWLATAAVVKWVSRHAPASLRPAGARLRDRLWGGRRPS